MKKYLMFIFIVLFAFPMFVNAKELYYDYFYKKDEQGNYINDAEFKLKSANGKLEYDVTYDSEERAYKYSQLVDETYDNLKGIIPTDIQDTLSGLNSMADFTPIINVYNEGTISNFDRMRVECVTYEQSNLYVDSAEYEKRYDVRKLFGTPKYGYCQIGVPIVMILEETKTPKGLEKETAVFPAVAELFYYFDQDTEEVNDTKYDIYMMNDYVYRYGSNDVNVYAYYKYDDKVDYNDTESAYNAFLNYDDSMKYDESGCADMITFNNKDDSYKITRMKKSTNIIKSGDDFEEKACTPIIVDRRGTSNLSISNYVNSEEEIDIEETSTVQIKVHLKNDGKAPSYDNVIISYVPEGTEYVSGSATDNGVYSEEDKTVTWNFAYLDAKEGYMFAYDVVVPTGSKSSVYVTTSAATSEDSQTPIVSNEARVLTPGAGNSNNEIVNPKTGDARLSLIVVLLIISFGFSYYFITKRNMNL